MEEENYEEMMNQSAIIGATNNNNAQSAQLYMQEQERGLVDVQLEVDSIKSDVYHLIRQDYQKTNKEGSLDWIELTDKKQRILSDWGVDRIMQIIHFYVNKNTLLSNFGEDQIKTIMLRFLTELNDLVLLKYQLLFKQPTFEECKEIIEDRIKNKTKMRKFTLEILGRKIDKVEEKEINDKFLKEIESNLEREMEKVRSEERKEKIRDYGLIIAQLEVMILSTLNRAWKGEERGSIRRHTNISELIGGRAPANQTKGGVFSWGRK